MTRESYPSEEVARHAAAEIVRRSPCLLVIGVGWDGTDDAVRLVECGELPEDVSGDVMLEARRLLGRMLRLKGGS